MHFVGTRFEGVYLIEVDKRTDHRGFFARTYCVREFEAHGLASTFVQCNMSRNPRRGTLRGLHYQSPPDAESKLVRCSRGSIYDVIVDMRQDSPTYAEHLGFELSIQNDLGLYIPAGFAHGFQTLEDETDVLYQMSDFYSPQSASGLRFDDPDLHIVWPLPVAVISDADLNWPLIAQKQSPFRTCMLKITG